MFYYCKLHLLIFSKNLKFLGIKVPDPVFSCSIEPPSSSLINQFERALAELTVEDLSLRVRKDQETNQTILEGMGELHIEVVKERLFREYGLNVFMGPLRVCIILFILTKFIVLIIFRLAIVKS